MVQMVEEHNHTHSSQSELKPQSPHKGVYFTKMDFQNEQMMTAFFKQPCKHVLCTDKLRSTHAQNIQFP